MIRIVIIGFGKIAQIAHLDSIFNNSNVVLSGIIDINGVDKDIVKKYNLNFSGKSISNYMNMFDAAIVATPPSFRFDILKLLISNGKHVLCEKPLFDNITAIDSLARILQNSGLVFGVAHTYRFAPNRLFIKEHLGKYLNTNSKTEIKIVQGSVASWESYSGYSYNKEMVPGGVLLNEGIHCLDFLTWIWGGFELVDYKDDNIGGLESNAKLILLNSNYSNISCIYNLSRTFNFENIILIKNDFVEIKIPIWEFDKIYINNKLLKLEDKALSDVFNSQFENFINAIKNKETVMCDFEEAGKSLKIIFECYKMRHSSLKLANLLPGEIY